MTSQKPHYYRSDQVPEIVHNQFMQMTDLVVSLEKATEGDFDGAHRNVDDGMRYILKGNEEYPGMYLTDRCQEWTDRTKRAITRVETSRLGENQDQVKGMIEVQFFYGNHLVLAMEDAINGDYQSARQHCEIARMNIETAVKKYPGDYFNQESSTSFVDKTQKMIGDLENQGYLK